MSTEDQAQDELTAATIAAVERIDEAIRRRDVDAVMAAMTDDCVFESTFPAPDGAMARPTTGPCSSASALRSAR